MKRRSVVTSAKKPTNGGNYARELAQMFKDWRMQWGEVARKRSTIADAMSSLTVAAVALPLNLALAVACGLPPIAGLVAGAVGGAIAAVFGGTPLQVTGPAAALQVMVLAIAVQFGPIGVAAATVIVGAIQLGLSFATAGRFGKLVPESVLAGFTTGVGLKLLENQIPELLGFDYKVSAIVTMMHRPLWLHDVSWLSVVCGLSVALLIVTAAKYKRFPAALVGVSIVTFLAVYLDWDIARVGAVPSQFPSPKMPLVADDQWLDLLIETVPLALLAAVESLLSASVVDRMQPADQPKHNPNLELFGQGLANTVTGFFGGMPVTGVVVRSSVNVQSGGKTKLAALGHALLLGATVLFLSKEIARVPLAGLAGLLCVIAFRLIEVKTLVHLFKESKLEALAFVITMLGTVTGHLMAGVVLGLLVHFARRFFYRREEAEKEQFAKERQLGIRATLAAKTHGEARRPTHHDPPSPAHWIPHIRGKAIVPTSAFVHEHASLIGRVVLGENVHIASGASVRADEGEPFFIGDNSNVQDGVVIHALRDKKVRVGAEEWAVYIGRHVSLAHDALVHGPCYVGDDTFIGFKAVVHDSIVGANCFIGICSVVVGVEIPPGRFVPHGRIVDSQDAVDLLPHVNETQHEFNKDVVDVNRGLSAAYRHLAPAKAVRPQVLFEKLRRTRGYDERF